MAGRHCRGVAAFHLAPSSSQQLRVEPWDVPKLRRTLWLHHRTAPVWCSVPATGPTAAAAAVAAVAALVLGRCRLTGRSSLVQEASGRVPRPAFRSGPKRTGRTVGLQQHPRAGCKDALAVGALTDMNQEHGCPVNAVRGPTTSMGAVIATDKAISLGAFRAVLVWPSVQTLQPRVLCSAARHEFRVLRLTASGGKALAVGRNLGLLPPLRAVCVRGSLAAPARLPSPRCRVTAAAMRGEALAVERRSGAEPGAEGTTFTFDGRAPLLLSRAAPPLRAAPRLVQLVAFAERIGEMCRLQHPEARGCERDRPRHVRFTIPGTGTPVLVAAYGTVSGMTYIVSSEEMLDALDVLGYLSFPACCRPDLLECAIPASLRPRARFSLLLLGPKARMALRRDTPMYCQCCFVLSGRLQVRMLPAKVAAETLEAHVGDLGCAVAPLDLFAELPTPHRKLQVDMWCAEASEGDALLISPGWWHQCESPDGLAVVAMAPFITEAAVPQALEELRAWLKESVAPGTPTAGTSPLDELTAACTQVAAGRPPDGHTGVGGWPFARPARSQGHSEELRRGEGDFNSALRALIEKHPAFVFGGVALPADAPLWRQEELETFVASRGFLAPRRRFPQGPRPGPPLRLREWLWKPVTDAGPSRWRPSGDVPRVIWMYWSSGAASLTGFRRLCVHTWRVQNPGWQLVILDKYSALEYVDACELPDCYNELESAQQADALRLALLARYGGVYTDVATLCLRPLDDWVWDEVAGGPEPRGLGAFYLACFGAEPGVSREYVENWFLAARRGHPLIKAWRDVHSAGWRDAQTRFDFLQGPLFREVDLSYISIEEHRTWLTMHICFKKLIDEDPEMRRIWDEEMLLLRADDGAMAWMGEVDASSDEDCARRWVFTEDDSWSERVLTTAPMLKFTGGPAGALQSQPTEHLVGRGNCLARVLAGALPWGPDEASGG